MKKVSVVVPCYNAENHIGRFLDSILSQTYKNIELILINDGSKDKTEEVIFSYKEKFKEKNIEYIYIYKENGGAASAINKGLKVFKGDYLIWPDCDDILESTSIEKRVVFLENNLSYDLVRSGAKKVLEKNIDKKIGTLKNKYDYNEDIFLNLILEKTPACTGSFMLRRENILKNISNLSIYESNGGQNWQIELPNTYKQKCGFIEEELYTYVIREDSHSHKNSNNLEIMLERLKEHKNILNITISNMNMSTEEKNKYFSIIENKYLKRELLIYCKLLDKKKSEEIYLKINKDIDLKLKVIYLLNKFNLLKICLKIKKIFVFY